MLFWGDSNMLCFNEKDKLEIINAYRAILFNLKCYLQQYNDGSKLEYAKMAIRMIHSGAISVNRTIRFDDTFNYFGLPVEVSQGVQVMYGVCCCRHVTEFLYDLLCLFNYDISLMYLWVDNTMGTWRVVKPQVEKANHIAILYKNDGEYILDAANKFILQKYEGGKLESIDVERFDNLGAYHDDNIQVVGKILKKYYTCRDLGVQTIY